MFARHPLPLSQLPQQYPHNSNTKTTTKPSENLKHKPINHSLCCYSSYNSCGVPEELRNRAFLGSRREADNYDGDDDDDDDCIGIKEAKKQGIRMYCKIQQAEEEGEAAAAALIVRNFNIHPKIGQNFDELYSIVALLNKCAEKKDLVKGNRVHDDIVRRGLLEKNIFIGNALVSMYAKCGSLTKAQEVCDNLPVRNEVSWNSIISGYTQHGHGEDALRCFGRMQLEGLSPSAVTYACILKAIGSLEAIDKGKEIHTQIVKEGLFEKHVVVGTALVDMYAKSGFLSEAHDVFSQLPCRNIVSCNALIAGYAKSGQGEDALSVFEQMQLEDLSANTVTFICIAKACGSLRDIERGQEIHAEIVKKGLLEKDVVVANALVDMYAKCGQLAEAHTVLNKLPARDVVSFSVLIAGYAQQGDGEEALKCYEQMHREGLSPDAVTFICILKACTLMNAADIRDNIHAQIVKDGLLEKDLFVGSALVDMYAKCGLLSKAQEVFDRLPVRDVVTYSALIAGYAQHGPGEEALNCFDRMQLEGLSPNILTFICVFRACANIGATDRGEEIHGRFVADESLKKDLVLGTSLVDMYAKFGSLRKAQGVFDKLRVRDIVAWNALIAGYTQHGQVNESLHYFDRMQCEGVMPDEATFSCILKACASIEAAEKGQEIYSMIVREGDLEKDIIVGTALLDMYAKCGLLAEAKYVFDRLQDRNVVSWNALMGGYVQNANDEEALDCFRQMQVEGISPNALTFIVILKACGSAGAVYKGQEIHVRIATERLLEKDAAVGVALADMYAKCGLFRKAQDVLDRLPVWNVVVWNTLMAGHAQFGKTENIFKSFDTMLKEGIIPDLITFTILLNTCSHAGLLNEAQMYFESMNTAYGIIPALEQYTCMVDLFCRTGHLDKAVALIKEMSLCANLTVWLTLLGACQTLGDMEIGILAFQYGAQLDGKDAAMYVCISNIYATVGRQEGAEIIKATQVKDNYVLS